MQNNRSTAAGSRKTDLSTNNHNCCLRCRLLLKAPQDEFHFAFYEIREAGETLWHFPIEPHWWRDPGAEERRERVINNFDLDHLDSVAGLLKIELQDDLTDVEHIARAVRKAVSLGWLIGVGRQWFGKHQSKDQREMSAQYWMLNHAEVALELAWWKILDAPPQLLGPGISLAMARPFDVEIATV